MIRYPPIQYIGSFGTTVLLLAVVGYLRLLEFKRRSYTLKKTSKPPQCKVIIFKDFSTYSLRPKKQVILGFKICPNKHVILPYLESVYACKNQLVPNMGSKQGQARSFCPFVNLSQNSQDDLFFGTEGVFSKYQCQIMPRESKRARCCCLMFGSRVNHHCNPIVPATWSLDGSLASFRPSGLVWSDVDDLFLWMRRPFLRGKLCISEDAIKVTCAGGGEHCGKDLTYLV